MLLMSFNNDKRLYTPWGYGMILPPSHTSLFTPHTSTLQWGRNVYSSVIRFLQFQLTANVVSEGFGWDGSSSKY